MPGHYDDTSFMGLKTLLVFQVLSSLITQDLRQLKNDVMNIVNVMWNIE